MTGEVYHVVGPPGCGKTTHLSRQAARAVATRGPDSVLALSLTRTAAAEIAGRDTGIPPERIGTLHGICYRAIGERALVLDSPKGVAKWNEWAAANDNDMWRLTGAGTDPDDPHGDRGGRDGVPRPGDDLLERMNLLRHKMIPEELWLGSVREFASAWRACCLELGATDFTGLIETGLEMDIAPGAPSALLCDEVQDWSKLEASVVHRWAQGADTTVLVGDEDQCLYLWRGASSRIFLDNPVDEGHRRVLGQSYRVPQAVHGIAQRIIGRIRERTVVDYAPTAVPGEVDPVHHGQWARPEGWLDLVVRKLEACEREGVTDPAKGVMVLAPCSYQLDPLLALLRKEGLPFANRFRRKRGDWNPLAGVSTDRGTGANQLAAFLDGSEAGWTTAQLRLWIPLLRSCVRRGDDGVLARGAKTLVETTELEQLAPKAFDELFRSPFDGDRAKERNIEWLLDGCDTKNRARVRFPVAVYRRHGLKALQKEPLLSVGTIHSAKGGEAAHVFLVTALPSRWTRQPDADEIHRLFYVGATRASRSLSLLSGDVGRYQV